jgi:hypothetical protein
MAPRALDLSGAADTVEIFHAITAATVVRMTFLYTEGTDNFAASGLKIGKESDDDYYYTGNCEPNKAQWYEHTIDPLKRDIAAGDTVLFYSAGGFGGAGEIKMTLEYVYGAE